MAEGSRQESRVPYSGEQEDAPSIVAPNDYLSIRANPNTTGAQVGEAIQGIGKGVEEVSQGSMDIWRVQQGIKNETAYTQADSDYQIQSGKVMDEYRNLPLAEQTTKTDEYTDKLLKVRNDLRSALPNPAAQRGFDQLTMRSQGYMIRDLGTLAASSHKQLFKQTAQASVNVSIDGASRPEVAFNEQRFQDQVANVKFQIPGIVAIDDIDVNKVGAKVDDKGNVTFPDTPEGNQAKVIYTDTLNKAMDQIWKNRIDTLSSDPDKGSPMLAEKVLQDHKNEIPSKIYAELSHQLYPAIRNEETRSYVNEKLGEVNGDYQKSAGSPAASQYPVFDEKKATESIGHLFPGSMITSTGRDVEYNKEVHGKPNSEHLELIPGDKNSGQATDFTPPVDDQGNRLSLNEVRFRMKQQGYPVTELVAEKGDKIVLDINEADHIHWGFKQKGRTALTQADQGTPYTSQEQYLLQHRSDIIDGIVTNAQTDHPNWGATELDTIRQRTTQQVDQQISQQQGKDRANRLTLVNWAQKAHQTSLDQISSAPPDVQQAYKETLANDSWYVMNFHNRLVTANSKGQSQNYGTEYYNLLTKAMTGKLSDVGQLPDIGYGKDAVLTNTGLKSLLMTMQTANTPEGIAFNKPEVEFLNKAKGLVSASGIAPGLKTQELDEKFNNYIQWALPKIEAGRSKGLTPDDLFNEKSPDFVGWPKATDPMEVSKQVMYQRMQQLSEKKHQDAKPLTLNSLSNLMTARRNNQINDDQFRQIAKKNPKWFSTKTPTTEGPNALND